MENKLMHSNSIHAMTRYFIMAILVCVFANLSAQTDYYREELLNLADLSRLPLYRAGEIEQLSSYDRTGNNDDGFSGKYSSIRKEAEGFVLADLKGPGVVNRIWTPTPETDTIKFYFDGEKKPRISLPFIELFNGKTYPFTSPLCGYDIGGFYCYLPIPYEKSLKIIYTGKNLRFHQTQYRTLLPGEKMKTYSIDKLKNYQDAFDKIAATWSKQTSPLSFYKNLKSKKINLTLSEGKEETLFELNSGGRIVGIEVGAGSDLLQAYRKIMLFARWDNESKNALELPLHNYFGFAFGKPAMQSVLLGSDKNKLYSYLPMPFDQSAKILLKYNPLNAADAKELVISGTIYYTDDKRDALHEGKLYVQSRREYNPGSGSAYTIADVKGRGHYIGSVLAAQGLEDGHTGFFEGDDQTIIDGKMKMHGTGSEDYFSGGYYAVMDKWDRGMSLPIHGSLEYSQMTSRTGGYRFYLSDKMNFNSSLNLTIEHQPEPATNVKADYTSVGLFYADRPQFENTAIDLEDNVAPIPHRDRVTPQNMKMIFYWNAAASYHNDCMEISSKVYDDWTAGIDIEAIPLVQIHLDDLDNGTYKLFVDFKKTANGNPFTIWQRSKQISEWIPTDIKEETKSVYAGEIQITDQLKTITIRRKKQDEAKINVCAFSFEKIK